MKEVGANSDIHWVLFDEENRAVGFHANSRGNQIYMSSASSPFFHSPSVDATPVPPSPSFSVNTDLQPPYVEASHRRRLAASPFASIRFRRRPLLNLHFVPRHRHHCPFVSTVGRLLRWPSTALKQSCTVRQVADDEPSTIVELDHLSLPSSTSGHSESSVRIVFDEFPHGAITDTSLDVGVRHGPTFRSLKVDPLSVDSIEGHNQVSGKGFPTTGPRIEAGNVVINRALRVSNVIACCSLCAIGCKELSTDRHRCSGVLYIVVMLMGYVVDWNCMSMNFKVLRLGVSFGITRLIRASFGITRLIRASFGITRLICASCGITRLIDASFGITRLIRAPFGVRVQRGADQREAGRMREGHMDASGFLYASADVFC
ncbi:hypothetical protein E6C27_scaffold22G00480 [Cucumis melo var. makuwa]|uniref:Mucin-19-like n=1 Tax=Cucumis melo var. makuwa TaxID=1194695 RepID=A0A5A7UYE3_CUCMM|nr:hypothetical protein E6C27_scaffold22G00480 [Cucumis melo var. makuwa]